MFLSTTRLLRTYYFHHDLIVYKPDCKLDFHILYEVLFAFYEEGTTWKILAGRCRLLTCSGRIQYASAALSSFFHALLKLTVAWASSHAISSDSRSLLSSSLSLFSLSSRRPLPSPSTFFAFNTKKGDP